MQWKIAKFISWICTEFHVKAEFCGFFADHRCKSAWKCEVRFGNWLGAAIVLSRVERIELYSRRLDFYSTSLRAFLCRSALCGCDRVAEDVCTPFRGQYLWLRAQGSRAFCPSSQQSRAFPLLFQRAGPGGGGSRRGAARMIKLPIDSHLFSAPPRILPSAMAGDAGHRCYVRPQNENNSRKAACASIYIPQTLPPSPFILTSLLVSSVPFWRSRNPTFEHACRSRLMRTNCALLFDDRMFIQIAKR